MCGTGIRIAELILRWGLNEEIDQWTVANSALVWSCVVGEGCSCLKKDVGV